MRIGGGEAHAGGEMIERRSPAHGVVVTRLPRGRAEDARAAIAAARTAFDIGPWPNETASNRARVLLKVAELIDRDRELLALMDALESGKPIAQAHGEIEGAADIWRYAASLARELSGESYGHLGADRLGFVLREPVGVVSIITPWNFPLLIVSQKLPFALAAGCTCVVKPSEMTSASTLQLGALLAEAGLPEGVCNIVTGYGPEVGSPMTTDRDVDMISFTGSTAVGRAAMAAGAATLKNVSMELGGKNPQVIFPDADMDAALDAATFGAYFNAGQCCNAGSRLLLHQDIAEEFLSDLAERSKRVKLGDPLDPQTRVGAIISADHIDRIESHVRAAREGGAVVRAGGARLESNGFFMEPTIVAGVVPSMAIASEEVFGPVVVALTFKTLDEAVQLANSTAYGLSASVWSSDIDTAVGVGRGVRAGTIWVNTFMDGTPELPFGGYRQSGIGRELGRNAVKDYTEEKTLHVHTGPRTSWWVPRGA
ncbi:aldehyde dehydrogenase family protein [Bradyrhizobium sp. GCM10027634]|uniref:aldehyde dehydrogenase family protein n=1 Tax=unclassified Bradyrhizobium TaxID=2631580 RepID=UPI00263BD8A7|nr:aldehyde dehydrogenase family protein [Bradyrhizobium sp. WYCCWR 12677]MDN5001226.1 aldehyde dehydrogenase family protein [Bradyrhizobium sp. WYCCWR 12677]